VFVHTSDEIIYQEVALYKVSTKGLMSGNIIDDIVRNYQARIIAVSPEYIVIEKTGHKSEISELLSKLETYGLLQFVRSGRVAVTKQVRELNSYLKEMDEANRYKPDEVEMYNRN
jgi:acetolactate synthase-1/3 small subunit